jgi:hypothetical protein
MAFDDREGQVAAIDDWLKTREWQSSLSPMHLYCLRSRLFSAWFFARHIPFPHMPEEAARLQEETLIPFPTLAIEKVFLWYLTEWYEGHGMFLLAEGQLPDTFDYQRN